MESEKWNKNNFLLDIPLVITGWDMCTILMTCALFFFFVIIIKKRFDMIDSV